MVRLKPICRLCKFNNRILDIVILLSLLHLGILCLKSTILSVELNNILQLNLSLSPEYEMTVSL